MSIERLVKEISHTQNGLYNAINTRREHPSYGYTKTDIRERYNILKGMVESWAYVTGIWDAPGAITWTRDFSEKVAAILDVDMRRIQATVRAL